MVIENFKERYLALKAEGKTDMQVARLFYVGHNSLYKLKKEHGLLGVSSYKPLNVTDEQLKIAVSNGIDKNTLRLRIIHHGWDVESAITTPKIPANERWRYKN
ncbi:hypothetical protein HPT25_23605 [Bacillus sp. BRMEA1]|uniref:hypothetical protein n=1 Tax=Neobacillus endophyticus TaxID=2738405 RepID=UPI0015649303|nr:hypothetical protein [Neobacillus endophyticus]NRD80312.1 hypothetical protein [Neobacillus endophyticus]